MERNASIEVLKEEMARYDRQIDTLCKMGQSDNRIVENLTTVRERIADQIKEMEKGVVLAKAIKNS